MAHSPAKFSPALKVIGAGLAGCEAAWQAAQRGIQVQLFEMRPLRQTGAHTSANLAEVVCSNSFGSTLPDRASGLLKQEMRQLGSLLLECAGACALPAGGALAVDREAFSHLVTERISAHPRINVIRQELTTLPDQPAVIASGPLTSPALSRSIQAFTGSEHLSFFDAVAPIVEAESIDMAIAYRGSRYGKGETAEGDYINCPLNKNEYLEFVSALVGAERVALKEFEAQINSGVRAGNSAFFEGCLPVEVLAQRSPDALAYGPLRPVGLRNPHTGTRMHAVVQLRQDNLAASLYNMVGFQTNLTYQEQQRVFRMIPGLSKAQFARFGQMHRNTFIASPLLLLPTLQARPREDLFFAGQITGVEGYVGNIATGWLAGVNAARRLNGQPLLTLPPATMLGALCRYITSADMRDFQPMKAIFGLLPPPEKQVFGRRNRAALYRQRAEAYLTEFLDQNPDFLARGENL